MTIQLIDNLIVGAGGGGKGGGSSHVPTEAPNTLQSRALARVIDLISEGEVQGLVDQTNKLKSVYFDDVPAMRSDGTLNFKGVTLEERYGLPDQTSIPGFSEVESEVTLQNTEVKFATPFNFTVTDTDITALRVALTIPNLSEVKDNGDLIGTSVRVKIEAQPFGGSYTTKIDTTITGKTVSPYQQQFRFALTGPYPIAVRVSRVTVDSTQATLHNQTFVASYTEIQEVKLSYPNSALIGIVVNSELFSGRVPRRSYDIKGIKVQIPSNYNPITRVYTGAWNGTFSTAWTDNPVWVLYDLLTNKRYGLGDFISPDQVDKTTFYSISQYCDQLVDNGFGSTEPRFTFNTVINERREAFEVINAVVSVFRGMAFWSAGGVTITQDSPKDPTRLVSPSDVINGEFQYSGTALKARHTAALVSWNDPDDNYKQTIEVVEDQELITRYGWRPIELTAFATTSRGQANRVGKWLLDSERYETETVTFTAGLDFADVRPGEIIMIADPVRQGTRVGGRVKQYLTGPARIKVDQNFVVASGDEIHVMNSADDIETLTLTANATASDTLVLSETPTGTIQPDALYIVQSSTLVPEKWRVLSIREVERTKYEVVCLEYDGTKFSRIEQGITLTPPPTSFLPTGPLTPPTSLAIEESLYKVNNATNTKVDISWTASTDPRVFLYRVEAKPPEDENWYIVETTPNISSQIASAKAGIWSFRVSAVQGNDPVNQSNFLLLENQTIVGKTAAPGNVTGLTAVREYDSTKLTWNVVSDIDLLGYDIRQGTTWETATVIAEAHVSNFITIATESVDAITFLVRARDELGTLSTLTTSVATTFPSIPAVTDMTLYQIGSTVRINWTPLPASPVVQYEIRRSPTTETWDTSSFVGRTGTPPLEVLASVASNTTIRFRIKPYVEFTSGQRSYGSETTKDIVKFPNVGWGLVFTQNEHTAWTGTKSASMEVTGSNELALKADQTFGTYTYTVNLGSAKTGRLFYAHTPLFLSLTELLLNDATMELNAATFPLTPVVNNSGVPQIQYFLVFSPEVEFLEADYSFTSVNVRVEFRRNSNDNFRPALSALTTYFNQPTEMQ